MSLNFSCLTRSRNVQSFVNKISNYSHSTYRSDGENIFSKLSSRITNSAFSSVDLQSFLKTSTINHWKLPTKYISSIVIYSSLTILLFLTCSIIFYIISYSNLKKFQSSKYRFKTISILFLIIITIFLLIEMIFLIENLNKTKISFGKSIEEINQQINPKNFSNHLKDLLTNFDSFSSNSIILDQSKLLMIKTLERLLNKSYFLDEINIFLTRINEDFNRIIENEYLKNSFKEFVLSYGDILNDLTNLNKKVCYFIDQNHLEIEEKLTSILNLIRKQFEYFIQISDEQFFQKLNWNFFHQNQQQQIRSKVSLIITLIIVTITFITIIPIAFLILILINYFYFHFYLTKNR